MTDFISILFIVFGILQIILFFKIWGMTNDVKKLKKQLSDENYIAYAQTAYLNGQKEIAKQYLDLQYGIIYPKYLKKKDSVDADRVWTSKTN